MRLRTALIAVLAAVAATLIGVGGPAAAAPRTPAAATTAPSVFHPLKPARLLDTRNAQVARPPNAGETVHLQIPGISLVPADATAVALTVTAVTPRTAGFVTVWKHGTIRPPTSDVTFQAGRTVANTVFVPIGVHGWVDLYNGSSEVLQLLADVAGYWTASSSDSSGQLVSVDPARLLDTRSDDGGSTLASGRTIPVAVAGLGGVPATGVSAAIVQITSTRSTAPGYLTAWATATARPTASNVVFARGGSITTLASVALGADGRFSLYNGSTQAVDAVVDVVGYVTTSGAATAPGSIVPLRPQRVMDTRHGIGSSGAVAAKGEVTLTVAGRGGIPSTGAGGALLTVTATDQRATGYLTVYPNGQNRVISSVVNWTPARTTSNLVVVPIGSGGRITLYNGSTGSTDFVVDVVGYTVGSA